MQEKKCIVAGCIIGKGGRVLLIKHKKLGAWLYPGGHVEENEHPHEAAVREAYEETGIKVRIVSCGKERIKGDKFAKPLPMPFAILLEHVPYDTGEHLHFDLVYAAKPIGKGKEKLNAEEATDIKWVSREEVNALKTFPNVKKVLMSYFSSCEH